MITSARRRAWANYVIQCQPPPAPPFDNGPAVNKKTRRVLNASFSSVRRGGDKEDDDEKEDEENQAEEEDEEKGEWSNGA